MDSRRSPNRRPSPKAGRAAAAGSSPLTAAADNVAAVRADVSRLSDLSRKTKDLGQGYAAQVSALRRDLALVERQIEFERERRKEVDRLVAAERVDVMPSEHADAIARREEDIRAVQEEKQSMLEWLRRGVAEAQTISLECESLREKAGSANLTQAELRAERDRLEEMERRLTSEVADATGRIRRLRDASGALEEHTDHQHSLQAVTDDIVRSAEADRDRLAADVEELQKRAREVETIEISVGCMAAGVRRALHTLGTLHQSVESGRLASEMEQAADDDDFDSDEDADPTRVTSVVLSSTKAKIGRCEAILLTLHSALKRYDHDERHRQARFKAEYAEDLRAARDHLNAFERKCNGEMADLEAIVRIREPQLREAIQLRDQANRSEAVQFGPFAGESHFSLEEYYQLENERLTAEAQQVREQNAALHAKVGELSGDYDAVRGLRREYRELEARKLALAQSIKGLEEEQTIMKMDLNEVVPAGASSSMKTPGSASRRPPWRVTSPAS